MKTLIILSTGLTYVQKCRKLASNVTEKAKCSKFEALLLIIYHFNNQIEIDENTQTSIANAKKEALAVFNDDLEINFLNTKIICEV